MTRRSTSEDDSQETSQRLKGDLESRASVTQRENAANEGPRAPSGATTKWWRTAIEEQLSLACTAQTYNGARRLLRRNQLVEIRIKPGMFAASIASTSPEPISVTVSRRALDDQTIGTITDFLVHHPLALAELNAGVLPEEIEGVIEALDETFTLSSRSGVQSMCTCVDEADPCVHKAALVLRFAEIGARDPYAVLMFAGVDHDALRDSLAARRTESFDPSVSQSENRLDPIVDPVAFYRRPVGDAARLVGRIRSASSGLDAVRRGAFEVDGQDLSDRLEALYAFVAQRSMESLSKGSAPSDD